MVACDETPLKVGPKKPKPGKKKAERYLLVFCTELYTHYLLGDRSLDTFKASVLTELGSRAGDPAVIVHDRYQNTTPPSSGRWSTNCAASICCGISTAPPRSTPTPPGRPRSPTRCAG